MSNFKWNKTRVSKPINNKAILMFYALDSYEIGYYNKENDRFHSISGDFAESIPKWWAEIPLPPEE